MALYLDFLLILLEIDWFYNRLLIYYKYVLSSYLYGYFSHIFWKMALCSNLSCIIIKVKVMVKVESDTSHMTSRLYGR